MTFISDCTKCWNIYGYLEAYYDASVFKWEVWETGENTAIAHNSFKKYLADGRTL